MTMPASAFSRTVRYATAGVGIVPNGITSPPAAQIPAISAASSISEEIRVSLPMAIASLCFFSSARTVVSARPT